MTDSFDFPRSLRQAQLELHQVRADLAALALTLPWSAEPMPAWSTPSGHWRPSSRPESPGWTEEEQQQVNALRDRARELSITISTHPFWGTVEPGRVIEARMALKHEHADNDPTERLSS
ncbi:hypothetical protein I5Q34_07600 [Streptomyces sp. AV19]|uniref:hypothetical protein n=1 Tax=Streptomyces sp. AV19 TaxID=2793068 RepID=UPI0018FE69D7|nr:hypothetical protein [Streptomyces sp. AV19]MBH1934161.1 hypothetical protein [Streptomyces sp. AV19]MDG4533575.1 hypothetical protein [Streptomyces sp. AV19]